MKIMTIHYNSKITEVEIDIKYLPGAHKLEQVE